jgi:hypothetical protein
MAAVAVGAVASLAVLYGIPSVVYLLVGRIRYAEAAVAAIEGDAALGESAMIARDIDLDVSAFPKPLVTVDDGAPNRSPETAPLTTLSA